MATQDWTTGTTSLPDSKISAIPFDIEFDWLVMSNLLQMTTAHNLDVDEHENKQNGCQTHSNSDVFHSADKIRWATLISVADLPPSLTLYHSTSPCCTLPRCHTHPHPLHLASPEVSHVQGPFDVADPPPPLASHLHHNVFHFIQRHPVGTQVSKLCKLRFLTHHPLPCPLPLNHTVVPAHPLHPPTPSLTPCPAASCDSLSKPSIWAPVTDSFK